MAVTIDSRPTVFGDRMIVTGSYEAGDTSIDLSSLLASIDAIVVNPSSTSPQPVEEGSDDTASDAVVTQTFDFATFSGTTITITPGQAGGTVVAGTFLVIGRR